MYTKIMVPLDGSRFAEQALPYALMLSRASGAELILALSHELPGSTIPDVTVPGMERLDEEAREWEHDYLRALAKRLREEFDQRTSLIFQQGAVVPAALEDVVNEEKPDLVVMTTHGRSGLSRMWLGSVADALVRELTVPILLIRPQEESAEDVEPANPFRRVLVPLDGSPTAEAALPHALRLAKLLEAEVTLLCVAFAPPTTLSTYLPQQSFLNRTDLAAQRSSAEAYLDRTVAELAESSLPHIETRVAEEPSPAVGILDEARELHADIIVMGTHGRSGIGRMVLGSVADKVVRGADRPVMLYRAG